MQQHEIIYNTIIKDLTRARKILNPENLIIIYLNIFSDIYFSLIQSMESILIILIFQNIKMKIQEEEQQLKNVVNDNDEQVSNPNNVVINTTKSQKKKKTKTEQTSNSASRINKKKNKYFHYEKLEY